MTHWLDWNRLAALELAAYREIADVDDEAPQHAIRIGQAEIPILVVPDLPIHAAPFLVSRYTRGDRDLVDVADLRGRMMTLEIRLARLEEKVTPPDAWELRYSYTAEIYPPPHMPLPPTRWMARQHSGSQP